MNKTNSKLEQILTEQTNDVYFHNGRYYIGGLDSNVYGYIG